MMPLLKKNQKRKRKRLLRATTMRMATVLRHKTVNTLKMAMVRNNSMAKKKASKNTAMNNSRLKRDKISRSTVMSSKNTGKKDRMDMVKRHTDVALICNRSTHK